MSWSKWKQTEAGRKFSREYNRKWNRTEHGKRLKMNSHYRLKYGITREEFEAMRIKQNNACALCLQPFGNQLPRVDHDHKTGKVRGLLHHGCNLGLAHIENTEFMANAKRYLCQYSESFGEVA